MTDINELDEHIAVNIQLNRLSKSKQIDVLTRAIDYLMDNPCMTRDEAVSKALKSMTGGDNRRGGGLRFLVNAWRRWHRGGAGNTRFYIEPGFFHYAIFSCFIVNYELSIITVCL